MSTNPPKPNYTMNGVAMDILFPCQADVLDGPNCPPTITFVVQNGQFGPSRDVVTQSNSAIGISPDLPIPTNTLCGGKVATKQSYKPTSMFKWNPDWTWDDQTASSILDFQFDTTCYYTDPSTIQAKEITINTSVPGKPPTTKTVPLTWLCKAWEDKSGFKIGGGIDNNQMIYSAVFIAIIISVVVVIWLVKFKN
jgi:hypothetical protein